MLRFEEKIERVSGVEEKRTIVVITTAKKDLTVLKSIMLQTTLPIVFPSGFELTVYPQTGRKAIEEVFRRLKYKRAIVYSKK